MVLRPEAHAEELALENEIEGSECCWLRSIGGDRSDHHKITMGIMHLRTSRLLLTIAAGVLSAASHAQPAPPALASAVPARTVETFDALFGGPHAGHRPVHARGLLVEGDFTPAPGGAWLSRAAHLNGAGTPILVRFSNFSGVPDAEDSAAAASPRGMAIRFLLPNDVDTDIVAHSYNGFPAATPEDFLAFLRAIPDPKALTAFAATRPAARDFLAAAKPIPASYGSEAYFGVNALRFISAAGVSRYGRYRIVPGEGTQYLTPEQASARAPRFLQDELAARLNRTPLAFRLMVQLAAPDDPVADGSIAWPDHRATVELGVLTLRSLAADQDTAQRHLRFMPTNLVSGIALSDDPMLAARSHAYRVAADRRNPPE